MIQRLQQDKFVSDGVDEHVQTRSSNVLAVVQTEKNGGRI